MISTAARLLPLLLICAACSNQADVNDLRARVAANEAQVAELRTQLAGLNNHVAQLEATQQAKPDSSAKQPQADAAAINRTVAECVRKVRSLDSAQPQSIGGRPYAEFDAFYNPGSSRVENNNRYVDQGPTYAFNKCMAARGMPLTY